MPGGSRRRGRPGGKSVNARDDDYGDLLRQLAEIHSKIEALLEERSGAEDGISADAARAALSNNQLRIRRRRFLGESLFGDPAWDMLTELSLSEFDGEPQPAEKLALATSVPQSTAFRWIEALVAEGWIVQAPDRSDPKRFLVRLSDKGRRSMNLVFSEPKVLTLNR
jgi:DNA-binding MarR family transcriptional regulator